MTDYYSVLGLSIEASKEEIKIAYRKLSKKFHPDKNAGDHFFEERFKQIQEAYEVLSEETKKRKYDKIYTNKTYSNTVQKPEIILFKVSNNSIKSNDKITVYWATKNATKISGNFTQTKLESSGSKTVAIKSPNNKNTVLITLIATNNSGHTCKSEITITLEEESRTNQQSVTKESNTSRTISETINNITKNKSLLFKFGKAILIAGFGVALYLVILNDNKRQHAYKLEKKIKREDEKKALRLKEDKYMNLVSRHIDTTLLKQSLEKLYVPETKCHSIYNSENKFVIYYRKNIFNHTSLNSKYLNKTGSYNWFRKLTTSTNEKNGISNRVIVVLEIVGGVEKERHYNYSKKRYDENWTQKESIRKVIIDAKSFKPICELE